jgi:hypothetical protein
MSGHFSIRHSSAAAELLQFVLALKGVSFLSDANQQRNNSTTINTMVAVKIECDCGQHYAFDVEPVNGQMASTVACPACGADGTATANAIIARKQPPPAAPPTSRIHVKLGPAVPPAQSAPAGVRVDGRTLGLVDRETAEIQARAKISWGDSQEEVMKYLMLQGFSVAEAQGLVQVLFKERLAALRVKGIRKIVTGVGLMCVPVIAYLGFAHIGVIPLKLMGIAVMVGLWGCWLVLTGIIMLAAPKMESGDVAE